VSATTLVSERIDLVPMAEPFLDAVVEGRRDEAERVLGVAIPDDWPGPGDRGFLGLRLRQVREQPQRQAWPPYAVALRHSGRQLIGHAGYHGPPGVNALGQTDAVEVGYTIFEAHRGCGYAQEAVRALIERAQDAGVAAVIGSVAPDNAPSLTILEKLGFVYRTTVWDQEDGEERVFVLELTPAV
jgi:RimJ/RimL family protein N-acetyltransferase